MARKKFLKKKFSFRLLGAMDGFAAVDGPDDISQLSSTSENVEMCVERSRQEILSILHRKTCFAHDILHS